MARQLALGKGCSVLQEEHVTFFPLPVDHGAHTSNSLIIGKYSTKLKMCIYHIEQSFCYLFIYFLPNTWPTKSESSLSFQDPHIFQFCFISGSISSLPSIRIKIIIIGCTLIPQILVLCFEEYGDEDSVHLCLPKSGCLREELRNTEQALFLAAELGTVASPLQRLRQLWKGRVFWTIKPVVVVSLNSFCRWLCSLKFLAI